eukprot:jgi/Psemu1/44934/gm1.44934_g
MKNKLQESPGSCNDKRSKTTEVEEANGERPRTYHIDKTEKKRSLAQMKKAKAKPPPACKHKRAVTIPIPTDHRSEPHRSFRSGLNGSFRSEPNRPFRSEPNRPFRSEPNRSFQSIKNPSPLDEGSKHSLAKPRPSRKRKPAVLIPIPTDDGSKPDHSFQSINIPSPLDEGSKHNILPVAKSLPALNCKPADPNHTSPTDMGSEPDQSFQSINIPSSLGKGSKHSLAKPRPSRKRKRKPAVLIPIPTDDGSKPDHSFQSINIPSPLDEGSKHNILPVAKSLPALNCKPVDLDHTSPTDMGSEPDQSFQFINIPSPLDEGSKHNILPVAKSLPALKCKPADPNHTSPTDNGSEPDQSFQSINIPSSLGKGSKHSLAKPHPSRKRKRKPAVLIPIPTDDGSKPDHSFQSNKIPSPWEEDTKHSLLAKRKGAFSCAAEPYPFIHSFKIPPPLNEESEHSRLRILAWKFCKNEVGQYYPDWVCPIQPFTNSIRYSHQTPQAMRVFYGRENGDKDKDISIRTIYGPMAVLRTTGFHPDSFVVRPFCERLQEISDLLASVVSKHPGISDFLPLDFNFLEIKIYKGKDVFCHPGTETPFQMVVDGKQKPIRIDCNKSVRLHNDWNFDNNGKQHPNDTARGDHPVVTLTIGSTRDLQFVRMENVRLGPNKNTWEKSTGGDTRFRFRLDHGSIFCLHPADEIPTRGSSGGTLYKTKHKANFPNTVGGVSIALVFRSVTATSCFSKINHNWLWKLDDKFSRDVKKCKKGKWKEYNPATANSKTDPTTPTRTKQYTEEHRAIVASIQQNILKRLDVLETGKPRWKKRFRRRSSAYTMHYSSDGGRIRSLKQKRLERLERTATEIASESHTTSRCARGDRLYHLANKPLDILPKELAFNFQFNPSCEEGPFERIHVRDGGTLTIQKGATLYDGQSEYLESATADDDWGPGPDPTQIMMAAPFMIGSLQLVSQQVLTFHPNNHSNINSCDSDSDSHSKSNDDCNDDCNDDRIYDAMTDTPQLSELRITSPALCAETDDIVSDRRARKATAEMLATDRYHNDRNHSGSNRSSNSNRNSNRGSNRGSNSNRSSKGSAITTQPRPTKSNTSKSSTTVPSTSKAMPASASASQKRSSFLEQDESVLREVLAELDRERQKRAELEAKVRVLEQEIHFHRKKNNSKSSKTSLRDYTLVKTERDAYKEILDAITQDRPAFSTGSSSATQSQSQSQSQPQTPSLPIHIVRLLEVMPWDVRVQEYVFGQEHVYEWQIYSADKKWQKDLRYFPTFFKTLPIVVPSPGRTVSDDTAAAAKNYGYLGGGTGSVAPPKQCVLTNLEGTTILNIDKGYPLPEDGGGWTWVGPWRVEKNNDTDDQGWAYSNETEIRSNPSAYHGEFRVPKRGTPNIPKRRRKWTRSRTLIDYPYASKMTQEYLKLIAEKSRLDAGLEKLSGQLVDTKMSLTTLEADKERTDARIRELEHQLNDTSNGTGTSNGQESGPGSNPGPSPGPGPLMDLGAGSKLTRVAARTIDTIRHTSDTSLKSIDSAKKVDDIRSAVTQWVSNTVQKQANAMSTSDKQDSAHGTVGSNSNSNSNGTATGKSIVAATTSTSSTTTTTQPVQNLPQHDPKQQLLDSLRDKGTGLFEILKQKGEQLDKIKQGSGAGGVGLPWQRKEESTNHSHNHNHNQAANSNNNNNNNNGPEPSSSLGTAPGSPKSNVYVPSGRTRFSSIGSIND